MGLGYIYIQLALLRCVRVDPKKLYRRAHAASVPVRQPACSAEQAGVAKHRYLYPNLFQAEAPDVLVFCLFVFWVGVEGGE